MAFPIYSFIKESRSPESIVHHEKILTTALWILDASLSLTSLVVGILTLLGIITLPHVAAYALIGVSGVITLTWVSWAIKAAVDNHRQTKS